MVRVLLVAAALMGVAELVISRTLAPTLSHLPQQVLDPRAGNLAQFIGSRVFAATTALIVLAAVAYLLTATWRGRVIPLLTALTVIAAAVATVVNAPATHVLASATVMTAAAGIAAVTFAGARWRIALPVLAAGVCLTAGRLPLLIDNLKFGSGVDANLAASAYSVAEASFIAVPILLALAIARGRMRWATVGAAVAVSLIAAAMLIASPSYAAILSTWAVGVTLSLPMPLYAAAAGAAGFVLVAATADPRIRGLSVGLVLLAVAGAQPSLIHHNITAVLALVLLASPQLMAGQNSEAGVEMPKYSTAAGGRVTPLSLKEAIDG